VKVLSKQEEFGKYNRKVIDEATGCDFSDCVYTIVTIFMISAFAASIFMGARG